MSYHVGITKDVESCVGEKVDDDTEGKPKVCQGKPREEKVECVVKCLYMEEEHAITECIRISQIPECPSE